MKIKNFIAGNINEAMALVRQELGSDAVILSNQTIAGKVHLTAAIDESFDFQIEDEQVTEVNVKAHFNESLLRECLDYHGLIDVVQHRILASARQIAFENNLRDDKKILQQTLAKLYRFTSLLDLQNPIKMFMGTPGSGKSTAIAKVATQAKIKGIKTAVVSVDNVRAGANKQLEAFADILELDFFFFKTPRQLFDFVKTADYDLVLIDTPGINPFLESEVAKVAEFAESIKGDKILTFDAGRNTDEAVEIADIFTHLGAQYLLPTRMDLTRRIGTILSIASCCELAFCSASVSASIANGLAVIDEQSLAKLILS